MMGGRCGTLLLGMVLAFPTLACGGNADTAAAPSPKPTPTTSAPDGLLFGHRGWSVGEGENTLDAVRRGLASGADGVEVDVRLTADGVAVLWHDSRLSDGGRVETTKRRELPESIDNLSAIVGEVRRRDKTLFLDLRWDATNDPSANLVEEAVTMACGIPDLMVGWSTDPVFQSAVERACPGTPVGWTPPIEGPAPDADELGRLRAQGVGLTLGWDSWDEDTVAEWLASVREADVQPIWCCEVPDSLKDDLEGAGTVMILDRPSR